MNLPNLLTIIRIILVPVFLILILTNYLFTAAVVFAIAGFTDLIDGTIARTFGSVTKLGANLDPVADKLLLSSAFIALTLKGLFPVWLVIIVVSRDILMLSIVITLKGFKIPVDTRPMIAGKLTTFFQVLTVLSALLTKDLPGINLLYIFTATITLISAAEYALRDSTS
jgi:cardiolipin synthase